MEKVSDCTELADFDYCVAVLSNDDWFYNVSNNWNINPDLQTVNQDHFKNVNQVCRAGLTRVANVAIIFTVCGHYSLVRSWIAAG